MSANNVPAVWKCHPLNTKYYFWNVSYGNHSWGNHHVNCLKNLLNHDPNSGLLNPKMVCNRPIAVWNSQLLQGNIYLLLNIYGFSESNVLALDGWCKLLTHLHEGLFPHVEILYSLLVNPGLQDNLIPPHCPSSSAPEATVSCQIGIPGQ